ncbi:MAG: SMP-30/gluconolactonase/LRE family protein [Rhodothermaceae bacterium]|nr:SMP-30/gluconolactonase/LRE family protein [Rhodothermaceae bacterium]
MRLSLILLFFLAACSQPEPQRLATPPTLLAVGAQLVQVDTSYSFTEGPAVDAAGNVYFTDQPNDRIMKWSTDGDISTFMQPAGRANGLFFDADGNLLACADENNQLWSISMDQEVTVLVNDFEGKRLNGPNDLWIDSKGGIYFSDPFYKRPYWSHEEKEIEEERLYYLSPDRESIRVVADGFVRPNGLIGTPDGSTLYVADIGDKKTYKFTINDDASLSERTLFTEMGSDGMTLDTAGNVYLTGPGVTVFNPAGEQIEHIEVPERWTANVTFGGADRKTLFVTAMKGVYTMEMNLAGARF